MRPSERRTERPSPDRTPEDYDAPLAENEAIGPRAITGEPEGEGERDAYEPEADD